MSFALCFPLNQAVSVGSGERRQQEWIWHGPTFIAVAFPATRPAEYFSSVAKISFRCSSNFPERRLMTE